MLFIRYFNPKCSFEKIIKMNFMTYFIYDVENFTHICIGYKAFK